MRRRRVGAPFVLVLAAATVAAAAWRLSTHWSFTCIVGALAAAACAAFAYRAFSARRRPSGRQAIGLRAIQALSAVAGYATLAAPGPAWLVALAAGFLLVVGLWLVVVARIAF